MSPSLSTTPRKESEPSRGIGHLVAGPFVANEDHVVLSLSIPGDPQSKQRSRWSRRNGSMYTPEPTRLREEGIRALAKLSPRELVLDTMGQFSLRAGFYLKGNQRRDADNMLKLVSDALTGLVWADDSQVVEVFAFKVPADQPAEARTELAVIRLPGVIAYTLATCLLCHRQYRTYPSWQFRMFCSRACYGLAHRARVALNCEQCGQRFEASKSLTGKRRFCSTACKVAYTKVPMTCTVCGAGFVMSRWQRRRTDRTTCSRPCASKVSRGKDARRGVEIRVELQDDAP